jgi:hypothetical protein
MGKDTEDIVFTTGQLICPFCGHQQSTRPRQPNNQAWAHNGIREGAPGCLYINAYNNQDSLVRWLRMAGHEDLVYCRIRCIPKQQGGGLGVYALDEIWNGQELLLANRKYPTNGTEASSETIPTPRLEVQEENSEDTDVFGAEEAVGEGAPGESRGHQHATCDDIGGWRMHEPSHLWKDGTLVQHSTPPPVNNIPRWTSLTAEYIKELKYPLLKPRHYVRTSG